MMKRINHALKGIFISFGISCAVLLFNSCASTEFRGGSDAAILEYQRKIALLEGRIALYENRIGESIESLRDISIRAGDIGGGIDEVIYLFDEYQRRVDELLRIYSEITGESGSSEVSETDNDNNLRSDDNS